MPDLVEEDRQHVNELFMSLNASGVSRGMSDGTHKEYLPIAFCFHSCSQGGVYSLMRQCLDSVRSFLYKGGWSSLIRSSATHPPEHSPQLIVTWIMDQYVGISQYCSNCKPD